MRQVWARLLLVSIAVTSAGMAPVVAHAASRTFESEPGRLLAHDVVAWRDIAARPVFPDIPEELVEVNRTLEPVDPVVDEPGTKIKPPSREALIGPVTSMRASANAPAANDFQAVAWNGIYTPDTNGAVGPNHVLTIFNGVVQIQTKTGTVLSSTSQTTFWTGLGASGFYDPKTTYDPVSGHFITVILSNQQSSTASVLIAASATSDPTGLWNRYRFSADSGGLYWADFPKLGFNGTWISVRANMFRVSDDTFFSNRYFNVSTADVESGAASPVNSTMDVGASGAKSPVVTLSAGQPTLYLVTVFSGNPGSYRIDTITGSVASPVYTVGTAVSAGQAWLSSFGGSTPNVNPQKDTTTGIASQGSDVANPAYRNGSLWAAHAVYLPNPGPVTRISTQMVQLSTGGAVQQIARVDDASGTFFYDFPSMAVNAAGDVLVGFTRFSAGTYASTGYAFRYASDPPNTFQAPVVYKAGEAKYVAIPPGDTRNRWGDYSAASADPANDNLWTVQQYATTPSGGNDRWGTWWARVIPNPAPAISFNPTSLSYSGQVVGTTSAAQTVTVTSNGQAALTITSVATSGTNAADFAKSADACTGATLSPGQQCTVSVRFTPSAAGARSASLAFTDNATGSPHTVPLSGTGVAAQPGISFNPTSLSFGTVLVGSTSTTQNVVVTSNGNVALTVSSVTITGTNPGDFSKTADTCTGASLTPGQTCSVTARFAPTAAGSRTAALSFADNASGSPHTVSMSGTGQQPQPGVSFNPTSLVWGDWVVGTTSTALSVTVTSNGTAPLTITTVGFGGTNAAEFSKSADTCTGATLSPGQTCTVSVRFTPSATGTRTATLLFTDNAPGSPQSVSLTGTGISPAPGISFSPSSLAFGSTTTGTTKTSTVTVTNTGSGTLNITASTITGANAADFSIQSNTCLVAVGPGATCQITVRFVPTTVGAKSATLSVTSNAPGSPHTVPLSGTGAAPVVLPSISPASMDFGTVRMGTTSSPGTFTVSNGATATGNLVVSTINVTSTVAGDFVKTSDACSGASLAPGGSCVIQVALHASTLGARSGTIVVNSNGAAKTASLTGTGIDDLPPDTSISTGGGSLLIGGLHSVTGTATDTLSGVQQVSVTFGGFSNLTVQATLACNTPKTSCTWTAAVPIQLIPGTYTISATARDFGPNDDPTPASIQATVI